MEKCIIIAKIQQLIRIVEFAEKALEQSKTDTSILVEYLGMENKWLEDLTLSQSIIFNKHLNNDTFPQISLVDDIANLNKRNIIFERINRKILNLILDNPIENISFSDIILSCFKEYHKNSSLINEKLRYIFNLLCDDKDFLNEQRFIYIEYINKLPDIKNNSFIEIEYCYNLAKLIIDRLATYNDSELNNITISRIINNYLILLRSIFILVDNYDILIVFEEYYNQVITEIKIKNLIKDAFIANYTDEKKLRL